MAELQCGPHLALRSTQLCALWRYEPHADPSRCEGDKAFAMHSIGYHMMGGWNFHGKKRMEPVDSGTVIAGSPGQYYGCKHSALQCDSVCAISLRPGAIDEEDQAIFEKQVLRGLRLPTLKQSLAVEDDEEFDSLIFEIFDHVSRASFTGSGTGRLNFRVQRMKRFIEQHAFEDIALSDIARSVGFSPFTCIRVFKNAVGRTPLRYLRQLRLERAKALLQKQRLTIGQVARQVGIRDRFYFARLFTREVGIPPQTFKQLAR